MTDNQVSGTAAHTALDRRQRRDVAAQADGGDSPRAATAMRSVLDEHLDGQ
jgi:hypothetical protein